MVQIKPKNDYILVEVLEEDSGVVTSTEPTFNERPQKGRVVALGDGYNPDINEKIEMDLEVGQVVYWQGGAGADTPPNIDSQGLALVRYIRLMGVENA